MSRFTNDTTGVVVSVDDSKDGRYTSGWTKGAGDGADHFGGLGETTLRTTTVDGTPTADAVDENRPKGNASRDDWAAYADSLGVSYADDAKRDDIVAAVDSRTA